MRTRITETVTETDADEQKHNAGNQAYVCWVGSNTSAPVAGVRRSNSVDHSTVKTRSYSVLEAQQL